MNLLRLWRLTALLCCLPALLSAQSYFTRSGRYPSDESRSAFRNFPCSGPLIFDETFNGLDSLPAGWTVYDLDSLAPRPEIAFLTPRGGWQLGPDLRDPSNGNLSLRSPSWYADTIGRSDDWLILPQIKDLPANTCLSWFAYSQDPFYPETYEVRISTGGNQVADFLVNGPFLSIEEDSVLNYRIVNLDTFAGQDIFIAFRHTSRDRFMLVLDEIRLSDSENIDVAMYEFNPLLPQPGKSVKLSGSIINNGITTLGIDSAQIRIMYQIDDQPIDTMNIKRRFTFQPNDTIRFAHDSLWTPTTDGVYRVKIWLSGIGIDDRPENDTLARWQGVGSKLGLPAAGNAPALSVHPNPSSGRVLLRRAATRQAWQVQFYDLAGRRVLPPLRLAEGQAETEADLSSLPPGIYFLRGEGEGAPPFFLRIVRQ